MTCSSPPITTMVSASVRVPACVVTMTAMATVIDGVGPEICDRVPPNTAAKKPTDMAPYKPAMGPRPEATPNASASGSATTEAVMPPKRSPRRFRRL